MKNKNKNKGDQQQENRSAKEEQKHTRSSAFNEPGNRDKKSTVNIEEANLEQERKEAMRERD